MVVPGVLASRLADVQRKHFRAAQCQTESNNIEYGEARHGYAVLAMLSEDQLMANVKTT